MSGEESFSLDPVEWARIAWGYRRDSSQDARIAALIALTLAVLETRWPGHAPTVGRGEASS